MQYHFQVKDLVGLTASFNYPDVLPVCRVVFLGVWSPGRLCLDPLVDSSLHF